MSDGPPPPGRVTVARDGHVAVVTVDHAERRNAMSVAVREGLVLALAALDDDGDVRAVVLTGAGERAFVTGADLRELAARTLAEQQAVIGPAGVFGAVARVPVPVVAAVNGDCLGGGLELALGCDLRVAAAHARLGQPEVALGLIPGGGATQLLPRLVGTAQALRLVLTGEPVDAVEALRIGLVHEVAPTADAARERAMALARTIASRGPMAVRAAKRAVREALDRPLADGRLLEAELFARCFASEDRREGVAAFLERRAPRFTGR